MTRYAVAPERSSIDVWTAKEGLLSKVAHDLQIAATGFSLSATVEGGRYTIRVAVPVDGLRVRGAVHAGVTTPMSDKDHKEIEQNIRGSSVFEAAKFPRIEYVAEGQGSPSGSFSIDGKLTIKGKTLPVPVQVQVTDRPDGPIVTGEVRFKQSQFGMKPYSAMFGTLKVKDEVRVSWSLALRPEAALAPT